MNQEIESNQEKNARIRILDILDQLKIPEGRRNKWLELWRRFPEEKWDSMKQIWMKILQRRDLSTRWEIGSLKGLELEAWHSRRLDHIWGSFEKALKKRLELEKDEGIDESSCDINERDGRLFECEEKRVWETRQLDSLDYEILLQEEKWELYLAVCCLVGYIVFGETLFPYNSCTETARKKSEELHELVLKSIKKGELQIEGEISEYHGAYWAKPGQGKCFITPYNFLKWAVLNNVYIPEKLQHETRLFQHEWFKQIEIKLKETQKEDNQEESGFFSRSIPRTLSRDPSEIRFCKNSDNWNKSDLLNRLACQAVAQVLWYLSSSRTNSSIEREIREDLFFKRLTNASNYKDKKTLWGWIKEVDPRTKKKRGRLPKQNPDTEVTNHGTLRLRIIDCTSDFEIQNEGEPDYWVPAYSFPKFKHVVFCYASALFHKNKVITPEEVFMHPIIKQYWGVESELCLKMIRDWIEEAYSFKKTST